MIFQTLDGLPVVAVSVGQMREVDRIAVEESGPPLKQMMEKAGRHLAEFTSEQWPRGVRIGPVVVLAGAGHNGGGGICAAYHLLSQGAEVRLCLGTPQVQLAEITAMQLERYLKADGLIIDAADISQVQPFLIIDALTGYGLHGEPRGQIGKLIHWTNACAVPVVSLDVPSGLDADSGEAHGVCIHATKTLTLALPKQGLMSNHVGELWLADIGIPENSYYRLGLNVHSPFAGASRIRLCIRKRHSPIFPGTPCC